MKGLDRINAANIALMVLSAGLALRYPFELFLFSYTVLGPLHYLTEISWLHDRGYYTRGRYDALFLVGLGVAVTLLFLGLFPSAPPGLTPALTCLAFLSALVFSLLSGPGPRAAGLIGAAAVSFLFSPSLAFREVFGLFLPTLLHVFVLTGLFVLAGSLKSRSLSGFLSLGVFTVIAASFFVLHPDPGHRLGEGIREHYGILREDGTLSSPFMGVNLGFLRDFHLRDFSNPGLSPAEFVSGVNDYLYHHPTALSLMAFIAFAYTYHYFNWFSKTSVIRWHEAPKVRMVAILLVWAASLGAYAYDYSVGLKWLFFLSFTHVLLEFPLNHRTAIEVVRGLGGGRKARA